LAHGLLCLCAHRPCAIFTAHAPILRPAGRGPRPASVSSLRVARRVALLPTGHGPQLASARRSSLSVGCNRTNVRTPRRIKTGARSLSGQILEDFSFVSLPLLSVSPTHAPLRRRRKPTTSSGRRSRPNKQREVAPLLVPSPVACSPCGERAAVERPGHGALFRVIL
jgi:hypothetical protein